MLAVIKMFKFMPTDINNIKKVLSCFQNLFIDDDHIIYNLPNMKVNAMKGLSVSILLSNEEIRHLTIALGHLSSDGSILGKVMCITLYSNY